MLKTTQPSEPSGSRKHVLDLVSSGTAPRALTELLVDVELAIEPHHRMRPHGQSDTEEWDLRRFCRDCAPAGTALGGIEGWWVSDEYKGPTWDLLAECTIRGTPGFLLVEAKAHESELQRQGKPVPAAPSDQSKANLKRIEDSLARTEQWLRANVAPSCRTRVDSYYQLANRLSAAEALASCGLPVVLLYLGFTGDTYFRDDHLRDDPHWQRVMGAYLDGVAPLWWPGQTTPHASGGSVAMLIRSLPATQVSVRMPGKP